MSERMSERLSVALLLSDYVSRHSTSSGPPGLINTFEATLLDFELCSVDWLASFTQSAGVASSGLGSFLKKLVLDCHTSLFGKTLGLGCDSSDRGIYLLRSGIVQPREIV